MRKLCNPIPNKLLYQLINYLRCVGIGIVTGIFYQFEWNTSLFLCKNLLYSGIFLTDLFPRKSIKPDRVFRRADLFLLPRQEFWHRDPEVWQISFYILHRTASFHKRASCCNLIRQIL